MNEGSTVLARSHPSICLPMASVFVAFASGCPYLELGKYLREKVVALAHEVSEGGRQKHAHTARYRHGSTRVRWVQPISFSMARAGVASWGLVFARETERQQLRVLRVHTRLLLFLR